MSGTIVKKNERGYGFISPGQGENDLFFHANELKDVRFDDLREGDTVTYEVSTGREGRPCAVNVTKA